MSVAFWLSLPPSVNEVLSACAHRKLARILFRIPFLLLPALFVELRDCPLGWQPYVPLYLQDFEYIFQNEAEFGRWVTTLTGCAKGRSIASALIEQTRKAKGDDVCEMVRWAM